MTPPPDPKGSVVKLALKRADLNELIRTDEVLRTAPLFKALGRKTEPLLQAGIARRYPHQTVLFQQGEPGNSLFLVLRGEVRLSGRKGSDVVELGAASRGQVFGELEVISGAALRGSSAVSQGEVEAAEFPRQGLLERGALLVELAGFLRPISEARLKALSEMTDFMNRW
ncbi:MAG: cyclic nucleotide-binding protein [Myxococcaceae bacterium]|nr:cyclic nucleotide-binding protein [Myxococcaceae bacterium]